MGTTEIPDGGHDVVVFVIALVPIDDGKSRHAVIETFRRQGGEGGGIDAAGEAEGQGNVGAETNPHALRQPVARPFHGFFPAHCLRRWRRPGIPVGITAHLPTGVDDGVRAGGELLDIQEISFPGLVERFVAVDEVAEDVALVDSRPPPRQGGDELDLRGEKEPGRGLHEI